MKNQRSIPVYKILDVPGLYNSLGYLDFNTIADLSYPYTIIISLRGGGKTYGALSWMLEHDKRFIYFRRTKIAAEIAATAAYSPFKIINADKGIDVQPQYNSKLGVGSFVLDDKTVGYVTSLSTFAGLRSIDGSDLDWMIFDEFIPQPEERSLYNSFTAWAHADETLNRNREADGRPGIRRLLMANSDTIYGDIVSGYGIGDCFMYMQEDGIEAVEFSPDMVLLRPKCEQLAERKKDTPLYRVTAGSDFARVALDNQFRIEDREKIRRQPVTEYKPICRVNGVTICRHKSGRRYYVTTSRIGQPKIYQDTDADRRRFLNENPGIYPAYMAKRVTFENLAAQMAFLKIYG